MAYDVIKTIGGREYRYRVQSERDAQTGKTRNRWTYVGRVDRGVDGDVAKARAARPNARLRLLAAAEKLLEGGDASAVTADSIAAAAGVAHGTFYRYFRDRSDALEALARHLRETGAIGDERLLDDAVVSREAARRDVRAWIVEKLRIARDRRASIRTWHTLIASDARLAAYREERRDSTLRRLREHLAILTQRGLAHVADPASTAATLIALFDGVIRATILESDRLDDAVIGAAADVAERAIFAQL